MTSSTKPEVHNVLHCRQRRTEPRLQVTRTENFVKFVHVGFWYMRADRQTDINRHADRSAWHPSQGEVIITWRWSAACWTGCGCVVLRWSGYCWVNTDSDAGLSRFSWKMRDKRVSVNESKFLQRHAPSANTNYRRQRCAVDNVKEDIQHRCTHQETQTA